MATGKFGGPCIAGHTAFIYDRGGKKRIDQLLDIFSIKWERGRDEISQAELVILGDACSEQANLLSSLRTHRHELVIFRGKDRVWEGPLHRLASHSDRFVIVAKDVLSYLDYTPMTKTWDNSYPNITTVTGRMEEIIEYELSHGRNQTSGTTVIPIPAWESLTPPINVLPYLNVHHWPNEARTSARTVPYEMNVYEHLANNARSSGIDFTTVGRAIHIWDTSRNLGRIQQLTEADFLSEVILTEYGSDHVQSSYVVGQEGLYGQAINVENLDYYGPWTQIHNAYNEESTDAPTQAELNSQASRNLSGRSPAPVEVRVPDNSGLLLSDTLTINQLVCGVQVPLLATLNARRMSQLQKLDHVVVTETSEGETVQVTLTPASRADSDEED